MTERDIGFQRSISKRNRSKFAQVAQSVEQRTENPRVTSSSLVPGIGLKSSVVDRETLRLDTSV